MQRSLTRPLPSLPYLPSHSNIRFVYRGDPAHYRLIQQLDHAELTNLKSKYKVYLLQREPIDICRQMLRKGLRQITYVTASNYETVAAVARQGQGAVSVDADQLGKAQEQETEQSRLLAMLKSHSLHIRRTYTDLHPRQAYLRICGYLGIRTSPADLSPYRHCHFSLQQLPASTPMLPYLHQLRHRYLNTASQLKLRKLDRIRDATQEEVNEALGKWRAAYAVQGVYGVTDRADREFMLRFGLENGLGESVEWEQLREGYGSKSYYALWGQSSANVGNSQ